MQDSEKPVVFCNWSAYFDGFFEKLPNIKKYHHFKMMAQVRGVVHVKEYTNTEESEINIMKRGQIQIDIETLPDTIIPKGLDAARQWYLYDEIRPYCKNTSETRTSCCKLTCAKPSQRVNDETDRRKCPKKFAESET